MKVIYVAGKFTGPTAREIAQNIRRAEECGIAVAQQLGAMPLIPHANTAHFHGTMTAGFWYDGTLELLRRCDEIVMLPGWQDSKGAREEYALAKERNLAVWLFVDGQIVVEGARRP